MSERMSHEEVITQVMIAGFREREAVEAERDEAIRERDALAAKVARVEALADDWQRTADEVRDRNTVEAQTLDGVVWHLLTALDASETP